MTYVLNFTFYIVNIYNYSNKFFLFLYNTGKKQFNTKTFNHTFPLILNQLYVNPLLHFGINIAFIIIISKCRIIWKNGELN